MRSHVFASVVWTGLALLPGLLPAQDSGSESALTAAQRKATVEYILSHQQDNGGFAEASKPGALASLPATFHAVYALKYFNGDLTNTKGCSEFVKGCWKKDSECFAASPGDKPSYRFTALGALIFYELRAYGVKDELSFTFPLIKAGEKLTKLDEYVFVGKAWARGNSRVLEATGWKELIKQVKGHGFADGTFGKGDTAIRDTASGVIAVRGLGGELHKEAEVAKMLREAQRPDGGWGKEFSDLATTSRVVEALSWIKGDSDVAACRRFVAKCRKENGSYALQPDQPGSLLATYEAGAALYNIQRVAATK